MKTKLGFIWKKCVEHPKRLDDFSEKVAKFNFCQQDLCTELDELYKEIENLIRAEVKYYYRRRKTSKFISVGTRLLAWIAGTAGVILLLSATAGGNNLAWLGGWEYVAFAISGSFVTANKLFGGSEAHYRYVATQLQLECLLTIARIKWSHIKAGMVGSPSPSDVKSAFNHMEQVAVKLHTLLDSETAQWGERLLEELDQLTHRYSHRSADEQEV